jgi:protein-S-isoprenylcysteine O-methyltransferase Ste14
VVAFVLTVLTVRADTALLFVGLPILLAMALSAAPGRTAHGQVFRLTTIILLMASAALGEFAVRGGGTPYPWDPPPRLVTTGPYAYLANPMQVSTVALLLMLAAAARSASLAAAALTSAAFGAGVAAPHEHGVLAVARALEHVNLGYAYLGWLLHLPGIAASAQLLVDATIAAPHPTGPRGQACPTPSNGCSTGRSPPSASTASPVSPPAPSPPPPG